MLAKSGGFAAHFDRGVVTHCPLCKIDNPDVENRGFCSGCGALFRDKSNWRLLVVKVASALGVLLTVSGAWLTMTSEWKWSGIAVFALGIIPLAFGVLANRQLAGFFLEALGRRAAKDTQRCLRTTDRLAAGLVVYFTAAFAGCIPYYFYIERPNSLNHRLQVERQRQLAEYQARFEGELNRYLKLIPDDALPPINAKECLAGKAVVVEKFESGGQISAAHVALSPDVRAETPGEVGTVVLVEWKDFRTGTYEDSQIPGLRVDGHVRIINLADKSFFLREEPIIGGPPPGEAPADGGPGRGPKSFDKIADYVNGLGRNPPSASVETGATTGEPEPPAAKDQANPKPEPNANQ